MAYNIRSCGFLADGHNLQKMIALSHVSIAIGWKQAESSAEMFCQLVVLLKQ